MHFAAVSILGTLAGDGCALCLGMVVRSVVMSGDGCALWLCALVVLLWLCCSGCALWLCALVVRSGCTALVVRSGCAALVVRSSCALCLVMVVLLWLCALSGDGCALWLCALSGDGCALCLGMVVRSFGSPCTEQLAGQNLCSYSIAMFRPYSYTSVI